MSDPIFEFYCLDCSFSSSVEDTAQYHADKYAHDVRHETQKTLDIDHRFGYQP
jgi:hypothetical protein